MAKDGKLLIRAKRRLEEKRTEQAAELQRRTAAVYAASPRIKELDTRIKATVLELVGIAFGVDKETQVKDIQEKHESLRRELRLELKKAGFDEDYLDDNYMCAFCKDTGYVSNKMCDCLETLYKTEKRASLSSLLKVGNETFESFNLSYYSDTPAQDTDISPRQNMEMIYEACLQYARKFGDNSMNLFFNGAPGLGKTFLSACIARVVSDKDFSVVYEVAGSIFSRYEDLRFSKSDDLEKTREDINRYLECDLLIIDDLGTELTTAVTVEALYTVVNTRLITNRKTIVNSNLTTDELRNRYSEQIASRLEGEYQVLTFYGDDIRKKKNVV